MNDTGNWVNGDPGLLLSSLKIVITIINVNSEIGIPSEAN
jgi:hypothetical protein